MATTEDDSAKILKIVGFIFLILELVVGLACIALGLWFCASPDIHAYLSVFVRSENDQTLVAAAGILLAVGFILTILTLVAAWGGYKKDMRFIQAFLGLIWLVFVLGLVCGFMCVGFRYDIWRFVKDGMRAQMQNDYQWSNKVGLAWNRVQVKKRCCGVDGSWDYFGSQWYADQNNDPVNPSNFVPLSCCTLNFNQDQQLTWVDPQNLQVKDVLRCNQDAQGYKDNSANLNGKGCFAALFTANKDVWHDVGVFTVMDVITGLGLSAGFLQIFAIWFAYTYLKKMQEREMAYSTKKGGRY